MVELERMDLESVKKTASDMMRQCQIQEINARYMYDRALKELEKYPDENNK